MLQQVSTIWQWRLAFFIFATCHGFLNIEELTNSKYALQIMNRPINENEIEDKAGLRLASKHGQYYFCILPVPTVKAATAEEDKIPKTVPVGSLLEPLRTDECFKFIKDWWTYEFCYGRHVLQYHIESNGDKRDVTQLGFYQADFDWNKEVLEDTMHSKRHIINRYHSQTYVNGTACDIINHYRDTEVRFFCEDSSRETYIERVDEPSTCTYIISIKTPYVCSHPRTKPVLSPKPESISCQPILSTSDFTGYQEVLSFKKLQAENEALKYLERESRLLKALQHDTIPINFQELQSLDAIQRHMSLRDFVMPNLNHETSQKMIERFANIEELDKLSSFEQRRLVADVSNLMKLHKGLPTADQARLVQQYVHRFLKKPSKKPFGLKKPVKVHLKFQKLNLEKTEDLTEEDFVNADDETFVDPAWKKLEDDITQGLEDAGYESDENHFEIRIISSNSGIGDSIKLDPEEGERFRQMLVEIVAGNSAMTKEVEKQKSLSDNYNMVWTKDSSTFTILDWEKEESETRNAMQ